MKGTSKAFLIINGVYGIISSSFLSILALIFLAAYNYGIQNPSDIESLGGLSPEFLLMFYRVYLIIFVVLLGVAITSTVLSFKATKSKNESVFIACIVFGALQFSVFGFVGGILGLSALKQEKEKNNTTERINHEENS